ncbi:MAG: serine hydrolase [Bdellovibrionales bacterium]|nr:serine hydrolase [Bdellovibrionales bacterium]
MRSVLLPLAVGFVLGGGAVGLSLQLLKSPKISTDIPEELHLGQSDFINPLVDCVPSPRGYLPNELELRSEMSASIEKAKEEKRADEVSVYFRDLINGPSLHINSQTPFIATKMLKVPILIAYYRKLQSNPELFDRNVIDSEGRSSSVRRLLERMIVNSDEGAAALLVSTQPDINIVSSLNDMGVPLVQKDGEYWVTAHAYASMFRILYNATYLGAQNSNAALKLLSRSAFDRGIVAGVDKGTTVAHKFGELENKGIHQFHDCGIVYLPKHPYLLCVMSRGANVEHQTRLMTELSNLVFTKMKDNLTN